MPSSLVKMDPPLEKIILWCLKKAPEERPQSTAELGENLLAYFKSRT
ncbi:hypothetical protein KKF84_19060 [Myxococcota bacterium]|nr:hypothetical protein [Myxococcota bacterium]